MNGVIYHNGTIFYAVKCDCGTDFHIQKSIMMEMGLNMGHADCPECKKVMRVKFNEELKQMDILGDKDNEN